MSLAPALESWHRLVREGNVQGLDDLLADDATFHSPVVHTPQRGKALTRAYLAAAFQVFSDDSFHYVREVCDGRHAILEFEVVIDGISVNGVDMITWNDADRIVDFKVMIRPLKAIGLVHQKMARMLEAFGPAAA